jgi:hypothetical protein
MDSAREADLVNAIIPRRNVRRLTTEVPKCKLQFSAVKMADSFSFLAAAAYGVAHAW